MKREDIQHLLGGYAAGTLTPSEQKILFAAAIEDQQLFDALADEQALKEILDDPDSRHFLRAALEEVAPPQPEEKKSSFWASWWPAMGLSGLAAAALAVVTIVGIKKSTEAPPATNTAKVEMASAAKPKDTVATAVPVPAPVPSQASGPAKPAAQTPPRVAAPAEAKPTSVAEADVRKAAPPKPDQAEPEAKAKKEIAAAPPPPVVPLQAPAPVTVPAQAPASAAPQPPAKDAEEARQSASQLYLAQFRQSQSEATQTLSQNRFAGAAPAPREMARTRRDQQPQTAAPAGAAVGGAGRAVASDAAKAQSADNATPNVGIKYQILRRNSQGQFVQTRLDTRFEEGDEIVLAIEKNSGGIVNVVQRPAGIAAPIAVQTLFEARTAPIRLTKGNLSFGITLTPTGDQRQVGRLADAGAASPRTLVETSGNSVYVVVPGASVAGISTEVRITVH